MRRPHGYHVWTDQETGRVTERDSVACRHCGRHVTVTPGGNGGAVGLGWCGRCAAPVCATCAASGRCLPFEARLAEVLR